MASYYVNKRVQPNGDHEVHRSDCRYLPSIENGEYLGEFSNCKDAVIEAKKRYHRSNGCYTCSRECHTS